LLSIVDLTALIIAEAAMTNFTDFEDGIQYTSALHINAAVIITRNKKDFTDSVISVLSREELIKLFRL
jgi:MinD superfamily P-loop ATPase